ncbi:PASTA domain-containing protein [Actinomadura oligospora]|uniref:PASTA domain-containing protein n=1 Tax=Actinomadura oligospora TaxID=111804 RepID=UPI001B80AAAF|nr:PASTA domain-containing protein [Actinomadura oligospora]
MSSRLLVAPVVLATAATVTVAGCGTHAGHRRHTTYRRVSGSVTVPSVVGMNHQKAQNLMQSRGLRNLAERDATGRNRKLLIDRNWVVVRQSPTAGARVSSGTQITLYSKKYTD